MIHMALFKYISPLIGSKGVYLLQDPFKTDEGEILECIAIRSLSDWIANNDDALANIYVSNGLTEDDYNSDLDVNMEVATLRNERGFVYNVPVKYIKEYPIQDGISYRSVAIVTALPAMRVTQDFTPTINEIAQVVTSNLGVKSSSKIVVTSHTRAISGTDDAALDTERRLAIGNASTIYDRLAEVENENDSLRQRIAVLENEIIRLKVK